MPEIRDISKPQRMDNPNAYKPASVHRLVELKVLVMLDAVPGWGYETKDHMEKLMESPYVQCVEFEREVDL